MVFSVCALLRFSLLCAWHVAAAGAGGNSLGYRGLEQPTWKVRIASYTILSAIQLYLQSMAGGIAAQHTPTTSKHECK
jgi:hypothetical protein